MPVAYFRFDAALAPRVRHDAIAPAPGAPILLLRIDSVTDEAVPVVAQTLAADAYAPAHTLAVAPRPGFVLATDADYAFVVRRDAADAAGAPLGVPATLRNLLAGPAHLAHAAGAGAAAKANAATLAPRFAALIAALGRRGVDVDEVAAVTFVHTSDAHGALHDLTERLRARHHVSIVDVAVDPDDGAAHARFCELHGRVTMPQFQRGTPPFASEGLFAANAEGVPIAQRDEDVPVVVTLPKGEMPVGGWPVVLYLHGSGGLASQVVDRGPRVGPELEPLAGHGPSHWLAQNGLAAVGVALPVNPERVVGAGSTAYLNIANLAAFRDTLRQGLVEHRLLIGALAELAITPAALADCAGSSLPSGADAHRLDVGRLGLLGQSQGGHYAYLLAAIEPRVRAVVPTGAGGHWSNFILISTKQQVGGVIAGLLKTEAKVHWLHPAMATLQNAWEPIETLVAASRLWRAPIAGARRDVLQPVGLGDSFYPSELFDALALAIGHRQAGPLVWPSMQEALALDGRDGLLAYPVSATDAHLGGAAVTSAVVQHPGDGVTDPHGVVYQDQGLQHQVSCFFASSLAIGVATLPAPVSPAQACDFD